MSKKSESQRAKAQGTDANQAEADRLIYSVEIDAPPDDVWGAITDPSRTRQYFYATAVRSDWLVGSRISYELPDGSEAISGLILEYDPPRRFAMTARFHFDRAAWGEGESRIAWEVSAGKSGTVLRIVHDRLRKSPVTLRIVRNGWVPICEGLTNHLVPSAAPRVTWEVE
jgi:uncharacterized protein YndB with AHSA1/START domain